MCDAGAEGVFVDWLFLLLDEDLFNGHLIESECSCFVGADVIGSAHGFAVGHVLDQIIVGAHSAQGEGESNGDCEWQSIGCNDNKVSGVTLRGRP